MGFVRDLIGGGAERRASNEQAAGIERANEERRRQFDLTRQDFAPAVGAGNLAREQQLVLAGLRGPEAEQTAIDNFIESPGQAFLRERQERAVLRNAAATGGLQGGNVLSALQEEAFGRAATQLGTRQDRLAGIAQSGNIANVNRAGIGGNISSNIAQGFTDQGTVRAQGILNQANARRSGLSRIAGAFTGGLSPRALLGSPFG